MYQGFSVGLQVFKVKNTGWLSLRETRRVLIYEESQSTVFLGFFILKVSLFYIKIFLADCVKDGESGFVLGFCSPQAVILTIYSSLPLVSGTIYQFFSPFASRSLKWIKPLYRGHNEILHYFEETDKEVSGKKWSKNASDLFLTFFSQYLDDRQLFIKSTRFFEALPAFYVELRSSLKN